MNVDDNITQSGKLSFPINLSLQKLKIKDGRSRKKINVSVRINQQDRGRLVLLNYTVAFQFTDGIQMDLFIKERKDDSESD